MNECRKVGYETKKQALSSLRKRKRKKSWWAGKSGTGHAYFCKQHGLWHLTSKKPFEKKNSNECRACIQKREGCNEAIMLDHTCGKPTSILLPNK